MSELTSSMQTRCLGRYLIDLPDTIHWSPGMEVSLYYGHREDFTEIDVILIDNDSSLERFAARVKRRAESIGAEINSKTNSSMLVLNKSLDDHRVLLRYFDDSGMDNYHRHEIHFLLANAHMLLFAESFKGVIGPVEARLVKLSTQLRPISTQPTQMGSGFCFGPVVIDSDNDYEMMTVSERDTRRRDIAFELTMNTMTPGSEESLFDRVNEGLGAFGLNASTLRKGTAHIAGEKADEVLLKFKEQGITELSFGLWAKPPTASLAKPNFELNMNTGGELLSRRPYDYLLKNPGWLKSAILDTSEPEDLPTVNSSLTDDEAIALWDAIVKSVRPRPGAVRATSK